jgi:nitrite reductase/ring-hydroxylating ferredoxin subunit
VKHVVGTVDEIAPGRRKIVTLEGRSIGVFNVNGSYFAIRNTCPHQGASLCLGDLYGTLESGGPGEYRYDPDLVVLRCPWHGWEFDVRTGQSWFDPVRTRVRRYEVTLDPASGAPRADGRIEGPYVAETYPVTVEESAQIVVEL